MKNSGKDLVSLISLMLISFIMYAQQAYVLSPDNPFSGIVISHFASPALGDIDADGDLDLMVGQFNSNVMLFFRNTGTAQLPAYEEQTGDDNPFDDYSSNSGGNAPGLVDIDADGDLDLFVGIWTYIIRHMKNNGTAAIPDFVFQYDGDNPLDEVMTEGICSYPAFVDIDGDLDQDVFITDGNGEIAYYENTGDPTQPVFELNTIDNPLGHVALNARTKIAFHDVSGDGLSDAVISHDASEPELLYFVNIGTNLNAVFEQRTGIDNPFEGITGTETLVPVFADIDHDQDKDLVLGTWQGIRLYEAVLISSASDTEKDTAIHVFPNPAHQAFTVQGDDILLIEVLNQQGSMVKRILPDGNTIMVDMAGESAGLYFVRTITEKQMTINKIILQ